MQNRDYGLSTMGQEQQMVKYFHIRIISFNLTRVPQLSFNFIRAATAATAESTVTISATVPISFK